MVDCENELPTRPQRAVRRFEQSEEQLSIRSHFTLQLSAPESYDGTTGFDDLVKRLLYYLVLADPRVMAIGLHYFKNNFTPATREDMASQYGRHQDIQGPHKKAHYRWSVLCKLVRQMAQAPTWVVTRGTLDDSGSETLRLLRERFGGTKRQMMTRTAHLVGIRHLRV